MGGGGRGGEYGREKGLTNERPQINHMRRGPIRGLTKNTLGLDIKHTHTRTDIAATRPNRPSWPIR